MAVAAAAARPAGRGEAIRRLEDEVLPLVDHVVEARTAEWDSAIEALAGAFRFDLRDDLQAVRLNVRDWLAEITLAVLSVEVVADVVDPGTWLAARGPWLAAVHPRRALPGPDWSAGTRIVRAVRRQLRPLCEAQWAELVSSHHQARAHGGGDGSYNDVCWRLYFMYFTSAAGMPWVKLADLPGGQELRHVLPRGSEWPGMVEWASCLAALLTHRARFTTDDVTTFVEPVRSLLPDLERVVNAIR